MSKVTNSIDYSAVKFDEPAKGTDGKYFIRTHCDEEDILFQLSKVETKSQIASSFDVAVSNQDNIDLLREGEDQMLALAKDNKENWFPDSGITDEYLDNAFMSFVKPVKKTSDVNFRMRTSSRLVVFDKTKEEVEPEEIEEGMYVSCIVQLSGIWFTKSRFGVVWKVFQVKQIPKKEKKKVVCLFEDADDDDYDEMENAFPDE